MAVKMAQKHKSSSFLKSGKKALAEKAAYEARLEQTKQASGSVTANRFFIREGDSTFITFLDGDLLVGDSDTEGLLDMVVYWEHQVTIGDNWRNYFPCINDEDSSCPICEIGNKPYFIGVFTIIDHTEWVDKAGQVHSDTKKLFAAKNQTLQQLQKIASKRGGLEGCRFEVSRIGDKAPRVGNQFDFEEKLNHKELSERYEDPDPFNYSDELLNYKTEEELRGLHLSPQTSSFKAGDKDVPF